MLSSRLEASDVDGDDGWMSKERIESDLAQGNTCLDSSRIGRIFEGERLLQTQFFSLIIAKTSLL